MTLYSALFLAFAWGIIWAGFLQFSEMGQFLVTKRTYWTVIIGVGMDLLILLGVIPWEIWKQVFWVIAISAIPIVLRSWRNEQCEQRDYERVMDEHTDAAG